MSEAVLSAFQGFLEQELARRNMSMREFALHVGVSPSVITRLLDKQRPTMPELTTLHKIAITTGADLLNLVGMIYPDTSDIDIESRQLARRISALPSEQRDVIDATLIGLALRAQNNRK